MMLSDWLRRPAMWLRAFMRRDAVEHDLDKEMRFHLEMEIEKNIRDGMDGAQARRRALVSFGGVQAHKEAVRDERGTRVLEDLAADFRYGIRSLRRRRGFAIIAVLTVALGIGATTAVFGLANWIILRPVPGVRDANELVTVEFQKQPGKMIGVGSATIADLARGTPALSGLAGHAPLSAVQVAMAGAGALSLAGDVVTGDYFGVLGVRPRLGRFFGPAELNPSLETRTIVISDRLWRDMFGEARDVIGQTMRINGGTFTIIGVAPPPFRGTERIGKVDVWFSPGVYTFLRRMRIAAGSGMADRGNRTFRELIGRLHPGATPAAAEAQLRHVMSGLVATYPKDLELLTAYRATVTPEIGLMPFDRERIESTMRLLLGIVSLVLVLACANTANLLLFRGLRRRPEFAVRRALGASTSRLFRQHVVEGITLGTLGGASGILVALVLSRVFQGEQLLGYTPVEGIPLDQRVLGFSVGVAIGAGLLFGFVAAWCGQGRDFLAHLKEATRSGTSSGGQLRGALTIVQVAASLALVITALLLAQTLRNLRRVDLGFEPHDVFAFNVDPHPQGYSADRLRAFRRTLLDRVGSRPGVQSVAATMAGPFAGATSSRNDVGPANFEGKKWPIPDIGVAYVSSGFFSAVGIRLLAGRDFTSVETDADSAHRSDAVIISAALARQLFGNETPLGKIFRQRSFDGAVQRRVVGIVGDTRLSSLRGAPEAVLYEPLSAAFQTNVGLIVRSHRPRRDVEALVRATVAEIDPALPISRSEMLTESIARSISAERVFAHLIGILAMLAVILAAVGLYSVIAYAVAERTREIGIRMALGARAATIVTMVVRQAGRVIVAGLLIGVALAVGVSRTLESRLFGVAPVDTITYVVSAALLVVLGAIASAQPARVATRVNPVDALRHD